MGLFQFWTTDGVHSSEASTERGASMTHAALQYAFRVFAPSDGDVCEMLGQEVDERTNELGPVRAISVSVDFSVPA